MRYTLLLGALVACASEAPQNATDGDANAGGDPVLIPGDDFELTYDDLAPFLEPVREQYNLPAIGAAIVQQNRLVGLGAIGVRKVGDDTEVTPHDQFHLGSCTKAMTATLLAIAVEDGTLTWETTLVDAFPHLAATMHADYQPVTLEHLATHWAGTWANIQVSHNTVWNILRTSTDPVGELRAWFAEQVLTEPPETPPGTQWEYSNAGYIVLGAALEQAMGDTWENLLTSRLFDPLGMSSCGFGPPGRADGVDQPWGHWGGELPMFADNPPAFGPAGRVHCNHADWAKFAALHVAGERGESSFLPTASFTRMHTPWLDRDYAHGWQIFDRSWAEGNAMMHAGTNTYLVRHRLDCSRDRHGISRSDEQRPRRRL